MPKRLKPYTLHTDGTVSYVDPLTGNLVHHAPFIPPEPLQALRPEHRRAITRHLLKNAQQTLFPIHREPETTQ